MGRSKRSGCTSSTIPTSWHLEVGRWSQSHGSTPHARSTWSGATSLSCFHWSATDTTVQVTWQICGIAYKNISWSDVFKFINSYMERRLWNAMKRLSSFVEWCMRRSFFTKWLIGEPSKLLRVLPCQLDVTFQKSEDFAKVAWGGKSTKSQMKRSTIQMTQIRIQIQMVLEKEDLVQDLQHIMQEW